MLARFSTVAGELGVADAERDVRGFAHKFYTEEGHKHWTNGEAESAKVVGKTRESTQEDLYNAIEQGDFPKWRFYIQIMPEEKATTTSYNPFDQTKVWPHQDYPLIEVGIMELNRNPDSYFAEVKLAAFCALQHRIGFRRFTGKNGAGEDLFLCRSPSLSSEYTL